MDAYMKKFIKIVSPEDLPAEAWSVVLGRHDDSDTQELYKKVGWLFRAVELRASGVMSVPFSIYKGNDEIDKSDDYQNVLKFLPNLKELTGLIEMSLVVWGAAYLYTLPNLLKTGVYSVRYLPPPTINVKINSDPNEPPVFVRRENGVEKEYGVDRIIYFWKNDPFVEFGPPNSSALTAATLSAGVVLDVNSFVSSFLQRGAIRPFLLTVKGPRKESELMKLKDFIARIFARDRRKSWPTEVVNAEEIAPVIIGEGIEAVAGKEALLGASKREEISTALGIPHSILFSRAANYAISEKDDFHFYDKTVVPECRFIESVLNMQLLGPMGYRLKYHPESLDIYQEDEEQRSASLSQFMDAIVKAETYDLALAALNIFGYEVSDEDLLRIKSFFDTRNSTQRIASVSKVEEDDSGESEVREELKKWLGKIRKRWTSQTKTAADVKFVPQYIPPGLYGAVVGQLEGCKSMDEVETVFRAAAEWANYP